LLQTDEINDFHEIEKDSYLPQTTKERKILRINVAEKQRSNDIRKDAPCL